MKVMDLQQEQLARSLGDGHRVIHGVAGSGKTMILAYRAEYLARHGVQAAKPILVLCFNEPLATHLDGLFQRKRLASRVHARNFHKWCRQQLVAYGLDLPPQGPEMFDQMVEGVIRAVERRLIPSGQYQAVLIDEGHDFRPEWLKLATQMVDPSTNSLLLLYDDAQSIYQRRQTRQFSFRSVGIQAQGRTTILKINYRNTRQILQLASQIAAELLAPEDRGDDGVPIIRPISHGREGDAPIVIRLPGLREEAWAIAEQLGAAHEQGHAWSDMAVLCRDFDALDACAAALQRHRLPHQVRRRSGQFRPDEDSIKLMTMKVSKGLEFPVVALAGAGRMPLRGEDEKEEARLFYVAATRATTRLILGLSGDGAFGVRLGA
jgi:superfamily I DNA/RNA helicase